MREDESHSSSIEGGGGKKKSKCSSGFFYRGKTSPRVLIEGGIWDKKTGNYRKGRA